MASVALLAGTVLVVAPAPASADSILGIPVASLNSTTQVGLPIVDYDSTPDGSPNKTAGWVRYFIPLNSSTSGTYGYSDVNGPSPCENNGDCVGTFADTGDGPGWLNMNLMFTPIAPEPLLSASLLFEFADLDLRYVNDPVGFLETVRVYSKDGTSVEAITPTFTAASSTSNTGVYNGVNYELTRQPGSAGASWPVYLNLWGDGLEDIITDPFWVRLRFTVPDGVPYGRNTSEYLRATLTTETEPHVVPEPMSILLLGAGLGVAALRRRKNGRAKSDS
jgi:hypothetical protein